MNKAELQFLLKRYQINPRKEQGQNFLLDNEVILSSVQAADIQPTDTVLEIGPGFGALTTELAKQAMRVVAVEQDQQLFPAVQTLAKQFTNIQAHNHDIRKFNLVAADLQDKQYKLVSNLPYSISSWVLRQFLEYPPSPVTMVVMLQKEVAQRVTAQPGKMSVLANAVQCFADVQIVRFVDRTSFFPVPAVDSAILKIVLKDQPASPDPKALLSLIKVGFSARRKQLHNNLHAGLQLEASTTEKILSDLHINTKARAQDLSLAQWEQLRQAIALL